VRETDSKSKPFAASVSTTRLAVGTVVALAIVVAVLGRDSLRALAAAALVTALGGRYFRRRIGGITGDCLGAANQLVELATYLALAWHS
jgi:adenosylcobinamide-GDP ribazoletransferase